MTDPTRQGRRYLRAAGVSAWMLSGVPAVAMLMGRFGIEGEIITLGPTRFAVWAAAAVAYGIAFWITSGQAGSDLPLRGAVSLLVVQSAAALVMYDVACTGLETMLLVVVAAQLGLFVRLPVAIVWVLVQTGGLAWLGVSHWGEQWSIGWALGIALPMEVLAMFTSYFAASQARARHELARTNAELRATQEILVESRQMAERARISRELHDLLGHHLTALSLNLEAARHQVDGPALEPIERSRSLTKLLLSDVREAVRTLRGEASVDLERVLAPLVEGISRPRIHLDLSDGFAIDDPERAQALVRCVQEIVTNAVRHASADNLWISVARQGNTIEVVGRDDGQGAKAVEPGQGLTGMRERLLSFHGSVQYTAPTEGGFEVRAVIPLADLRPEDSA